MITIYLDLLFCTNLIINYFLILATAKLNRMPIHRFRYVLGAALGAIYSLFIFMPDVGMPISIISKLVFSLSIVLTAFGRQNKKTFFRILTTFFGTTFALGGIMLGFWFIVKPEQMIISNGIIYFDISPATLILAAVIFYIIFGFLHTTVKKEVSHEMYYNIEVATELGSIYTKGIVDTGNSLSDLFTDTPVVVLSYNQIIPIIPKKCRDAFKNASLEGSIDLPSEWSAKYRLIPYKAVGGTGLLPAFKPKYFYIYKENRSILVNDILIAVSEEMSGEEKAIINPRVIELSEIEVPKCLKK